MYDKIKGILVSPVKGKGGGDSGAITLCVMTSDNRGGTSVSPIEGKSPRSSMDRARAF